MLHAGVLERLDRGVGRGQQGHQVTVSLDAFQLFLIVIDDDDALIDLGEQFGKMCADGSCACDDNFHYLNLVFKMIWLLVPQWLENFLPLAGRGLFIAYRSPFRFV